jgi:hypothetical protein
MAKGLESKQDMGQTPKQVIRLASCSCIFVFCLAPCFACRALLFEGYLSADHLVSDFLALYFLALYFLALYFLGLYFLPFLVLPVLVLPLLGLTSWPYSLGLILFACVWHHACLGPQLALDLARWDRGYLGPCTSWTVGYLGSQAALPWRGFTCFWLRFVCFNLAWVNSLRLMRLGSEKLRRLYAVAVEYEHRLDFAVYCFGCELRFNWTMAFCSRWSPIAHRRTGS